MDILGITIVAQVKELYLSFNLCDMVIAYINNTRAKLIQPHMGFLFYEDMCTFGNWDSMACIALTMLLMRFANMLAMMQAMCSPFKGQLEEHPTCEEMSIEFAMC